MQNFEGQIAVVTGASRGLGKTIALSLAEHGASLCLVGRHVDTLEAVAAEALAFNIPTRCYQADLTVDDDVRCLAMSLQQDYGHIDMLVHGAGIAFLEQFEDAPIDHLDIQYRINVRAPSLLTQSLVPLLSDGQIVFINSLIVKTVRAGIGQYKATRKALQALADTIRQEVNAGGYGW